MFTSPSGDSHIAKLENHLIRATDPGFERSGGDVTAPIEWIWAPGACLLVSFCSFFTRFHGPLCLGVKRLSVEEECSSES